MKAVKAFFCPTTLGQIGVSQRAIFPILVGTVKALANLSSASRSLVPVTVTFSGGAGACAETAIKVAQKANVRTSCIGIPRTVPSGEYTPLRKTVTIAPPQSR